MLCRFNVQLCNDIHEVFFLQVLCVMCFEVWFCGMDYKRNGCWLNFFLKTCMYVSI